MDIRKIIKYILQFLILVWIAYLLYIGYITIFSTKKSDDKYKHLYNEPLYNYSINKLKELYDIQDINNPRSLERFRDLFTTVNHLGDMVILSQSTGHEILSENEFDSGQIIFPFFSIRAILSFEGKGMQQKFAIVERKNTDINSVIPSPYALYKMQGISFDVAGGVGIRAVLSTTPPVVKNIINNLESLSIGLETYVGESVNAKGHYLFVNTFTPEFYNSIIEKNQQKKLLASSLLEFVKNPPKDQKKSISKFLDNKNDDHSNSYIKIWSASGDVEAEAGAKATMIINDSLGAESEALAKAKVSLSYVQYDIKTIGSDRIAKIQNTGFALKQVGASVSSDLDATIEVSDHTYLSKNTIEKSKDFAFINSIQYQGPIYYQDLSTERILFDKSYYVIGQSVSIARWKKYFIDDIIDYKNNLENAPYVKMLANKFHANPSRIVKFLRVSSTILNESLFNKGIEPTAFLIEATYSVSDPDELIYGNNLDDQKIVSMKIRYRLSDNLHEKHKLLKLGLNTGLAEFEIRLNKIEDAGSVQTIDLFNDSIKKESLSYSLLF